MLVGNKWRLDGLVYSDLLNDRVGEDFNGQAMQVGLRQAAGEGIASAACSLFQIIYTQQMGRADKIFGGRVGNAGEQGDFDGGG